MCVLTNVLGYICHVKEARAISLNWIILLPGTLFPYAPGISINVSLYIYQSFLFTKSLSLAENL